jgi:hypothetical protein
MRHATYTTMSQRHRDLLQETFEETFTADAGIARP